MNRSNREYSDHGKEIDYEVRLLLGPIKPITKMPYINFTKYEEDLYEILKHHEGPVEIKIEGMHLWIKSRNI